MKNFKIFSKIFQKAIDKPKTVWYNTIRYPKTAGFRKGVQLSCRGEVNSFLLYAFFGTGAVCAEKVFLYQFHMGGENYYA